MTAVQLPGVPPAESLGASARILVIDDDPNVSGLVMTILGSAGFQVEASEDVASALTLIERQSPDLIVLDLMLPGTDGLEACRQFRDMLGRSVAILMVSARGRAGVIDCLTAGADDYLAKPFDVAELEARVRTLLRARTLEAAAIRRAERLLSLQRISAAVVARLDEGELLELVLTEARRLLNASGVALFLWDAESGLLRLHQLTPDHPGAVVLPRKPGQGVVGMAFESRAPAWVNGYGAWPGAIPDVKQAGVVAAVAAPLVLGDEVLGVISARNLTTGATVDEEDAQILGLLAAHAAVGVANARAYAFQKESAARSASHAAKLEALLEAMTDGVLLVDEAGVITSANRSAATILGQPPGELVGQSLSQVLPSWRASDSSDEFPTPAPVELIRGLLAELDEREIVGEVDGEERVLALAALAVRGQGQGTLIVVRDVTDRRHSDERAAEAEKLRALGQLASGVAHDVNNLLAAVLGRAELARLEVARGQVDTPRLLEALGQIEHAAEDGARTVRRIQEFARIRTDADVAIVDLAGLARDTVALTRPSWRDAAQARGISIEVRIDLPSGLLVAAEPSELREVLTNLILNAVDAMPNGGQLSVVGRRTGELVQLDVSDTGVGMSRSVSRRVFEPFFTTKAEGGTGLGLAVSYGIIRRRGGQMAVSSVPDGGTTFTIELPFANLAVDPPPPQLAAPVPDRRQHVLFVDDEPGLAAIVQRLLLLEGFDVTVCSGGAEAVSVFDPALHDLVVTDYGMPGLTGVEVAQAIKERAPSVPVLLITGWGNDLDASAPPPGIAAIIGKPFRLGALIESVRSALGGAGRSSQSPA